MRLKVSILKTKAIFPDNQLQLQGLSAMPIINSTLSYTIWNPIKNIKAVFEYQHNLLKFNLALYFNFNSLFYSPFMKDSIIQVVWNVSSIASCLHTITTLLFLSLQPISSQMQYSVRLLNTIVLAKIIGI